MINLLSLAHTFIEFKKSFNKYYNDPSNERDGLSFCKIHANWQNVKNAYIVVSEHMSDDSINEAMDLIMDNF
jgi:hypothetical protein